MLYRATFDLVLRRLPPTVTHAAGSGLVRALAAPAPIRRRLRAHAFPDGAAIAVQALGRSFPSPLGAAAGLDKNADWFEGLGAIGFGFVEVGTVTPNPQPGNAAPTIIRLNDDRALLNRMGFPNHGSAAAALRLGARTRETIVGVNIGKQRTTPVERALDDYRLLAAQLGRYADYLVVNVSSPNTPGLRDLGAAERLEPLLSAVKEQLHGVPLLVKISPDAGDQEIDAITDLSVKLELAGIVATNTTVERGALRTHSEALKAFDGGGVSGPPLAPRSLEVLGRLYARLPHQPGAPVLISVGGIGSAEDLWERITHGATLVQAYTGFIYGGPRWPSRINHELAQRVREAGAATIGQLVGSAVR